MSAKHDCDICGDSLDYESQQIHGLCSSCSHEQEIEQAVNAAVADMTAQLDALKAREAKVIAAFDRIAAAVGPVSGWLTDSPEDMVARRITEIRAEVERLTLDRDEWHSVAIRSEQKAQRVLALATDEQLRAELARREAKGGGVSAQHTTDVDGGAGAGTTLAPFSQEG